MSSTEDPSLNPEAVLAAIHAEIAAKEEALEVRRKQRRASRFVDSYVKWLQAGFDRRLAINFRTMHGHITRMRDISTLWLKATAMGTNEAIRLMLSDGAKGAELNAGYYNHAEDLERIGRGMYLTAQSIRQANATATNVEALKNSIAANLAIVLEHTSSTFEASESQLMVEVPAVTLEDTVFGPFSIVVNFDRLGTSANGKPYIVTGPVPRHAQSVHPHVDFAGYLCEGDGAGMITQALQDGNLMLAVDLITAVLNDYSAESAYWTIPTVNEDGEIEYDMHCAVCEGGMHEGDDHSSCNSCSNTLCTDCGNWCDSCEHLQCDSCAGHCDGCERWRCSDCTASCSTCGNSCCYECIRATCDNCDEVCCTRCRLSASTALGADKASDLALDNVCPACVLKLKQENSEPPPQETGEPVSATQPEI